MWDSLAGGDRAAFDIFANSLTRSMTTRDLELKNLAVIDRPHSQTVLYKDPKNTKENRCGR